MSLYMNLSIYPTTQWRGPTPYQEKQPHTITLPLPCFTVGLTYFLSSLFSFGSLTCTIPSLEYRLYLNSSLNNTFFKSCTVQWMWSTANCNRNLMFFFLVVVFWRVCRFWVHYPLIVSLSFLPKYCKFQFLLFFAKFSQKIKKDHYATQLKSFYPCGHL